MTHPLRIAVIGQGRIGKLHALHVQEIARESGTCELAAVVDSNPERARAASERFSVPSFPSVQALIAAGVADASVIGTPTDCHRDHATALIAAGQRVLLEKPLTGSLEDDRTFARELREKHPNAVMLAFQRRFDEPLQHAKRLIDRNAIGRVFKIVSILEDSNPAPDGYVSGGILPDMSVHNVDEILWFCDGRMPVAAAAIGNSIYSRKLSTATEDFDDAFLYLWFDCDLAVQISVSRNHVSGYRVETWIFGENGQIHVGRFEHNRFEVMVEAYGRKDPIERKVYPTRNYGEGLPEFVDRFGAAYKAEVADFVERCRSRAPFTITHEDGLRAMEVIDLGSRRMINR